MSTAYNDRKTDELACDGSVVDFSFGFPITSTADLQVNLIDSDGNVSTLTLDTDYTVNSTSWTSGGTITTTSTYDSGNYIQIIGATSPTQETSFPDLGNYSPRDEMNALDKLTRIAQEVKTLLSSALKVYPNLDVEYFVQTLTSGKFLRYYDGVIQSSDFSDSDIQNIIDTLAAFQGDEPYTYIGQYVNNGQEQTTGLSIYPSNSENNASTGGDYTTAPDDTFALRYGGELLITSSIVSGKITAISSTSATVGGITVTLSPYKYFLIAVAYATSANNVSFLRVGSVLTGQEYLILGDSVYFVDGGVTGTVSSVTDNSDGTQTVVADDTYLAYPANKAVFLAFDTVDDIEESKLTNGATISVSNFSSSAKTGELRYIVQPLGTSTATGWSVIDLTSYQLKLLPNAGDLYSNLQVKNLFFASFFSDTNFSRRPLGLHTSADGINFKHLSDTFRGIDGTDRSFGDPSIFFKDGLFYVAFTNHVVDERDFSVARSKTLLDWEIVGCTLGSTPICATDGTAPGWSYAFSSGPEIWAPEWFEDDDGKIYITVSIQSDEDQTTVDGTEDYFRQYISECTDLENLVFGEPTEMEIDSKVGEGSALAADNVIDASIIKIDDDYYMALKDEAEKQINIWTATSLTGNWTSVYTDVFADLAPNDSLPKYTEAPCITPFYNEDGSKSYLIYADKYTDSNIYYKKTDDFLTYTDSETIEQQSIARHGTVLNLGLLDPDQFKMASDIINSALPFMVDPPRADIYAWKNLKDVANFPDLGTDFVPENATCYKWLGDDNSEYTVTLDGLPGDAVCPDGTYFYLLIAMDNYYLNALPRRFKISAGATNLTPSTYDIYIGQSQANCDQLFKFEKLESTWRCTSVGNYLTGRNNDYIDVSGLTDYTDLNNGNTDWYPINGYTYVNDGDYSQCVINDIPTDYTAGTTFYLQALTAETTAGSFLMVAGDNTHWTSDVTINNSQDGLLIPIRLVAGKWAIVGSI